MSDIGSCLVGMEIRVNTPPFRYAVLIRQDQTRQPTEPAFCAAQGTALCTRPSNVQNHTLCSVTAEPQTEPVPVVLLSSSFSPVLLCNLGMIQHARGDCERALVTLEHAKTIASLNPLVMFQHATVLNRLGRLVSELLRDAHVVTRPTWTAVAGNPAETSSVSEPCRMRQTKRET